MTTVGIFSKGTTDKHQMRGNGLVEEAELTGVVDGVEEAVWL